MSAVAAALIVVVGVASVAYFLRARTPDAPAGPHDRKQDVAARGHAGPADAAAEDQAVPTPGEPGPADTGSTPTGRTR